MPSRCRFVCVCVFFSCLHLFFIQLVLFSVSNNANVVCIIIVFLSHYRSSMISSLGCCRRVICIHFCPFFPAEMGEFIVIDKTLNVPVCTSNEDNHRNKFKGKTNAIRRHQRGRPCRTHMSLKGLLDVPFVRMCVCSEGGSHRNAGRSVFNNISIFRGRYATHRVDKMTIPSLKSDSAFFALASTARIRLRLRFACSPKKCT